MTNLHDESVTSETGKRIRNGRLIETEYRYSLSVCENRSVETLQTGVCLSWSHPSISGTSKPSSRSATDSTHLSPSAGIDRCHLVIKEGHNLDLEVLVGKCQAALGSLLGLWGREDAWLRLRVAESKQHVEVKDITSLGLAALGESGNFLFKCRTEAVMHDGRSYQTVRADDGSRHGCELLVVRTVFTSRELDSGTDHAAPPFARVDEPESPTASSRCLFRLADRIGFNPHTRRLEDARERR